MGHYDNFLFGKDWDGGRPMKGQRMFSRRRWVIVAAGLLTGFWAVAIPVCWPQNTNPNSGAAAGQVGYGQTEGAGQ